MTKSYKKFWLTLTIVLLMGVLVKAQERKSAATDTGITTKLAAMLSVDRAKALLVQQAMHYDQDKLTAVMRDNTLKMPDKIKAMKQINDERKSQLAQLLSTSQLAALHKRDSLDIRKKAIAYELNKRKLQQEATTGKSGLTNSDTLRQKNLRHDNH